MSRILDMINSNKDLKVLSKSELLQLSNEIREQMIKRLSVTGGHVGPNLGVIEFTVALHYVFNSPTDKIVFDVSHQCYTHKLLTGRKDAYLKPEKYASVSGFTNPSESEHDIFAIGHTSTAISLACGLAKARDLKGETNNVIAVVGDGALSGGEAFEGLNNAATFRSNIIIVINDNDISIAENHGGLYQNLRMLRESEGKAECNIFKALGFDYCFIRDGNDLNKVIGVLSKLKNSDHPVIVHMCTVKGKGYHFAEEDRENWHFMGHFDIDTGKLINEDTQFETYENLTRDYLVAKMKADSSIVAITAGTPKIFGFDEGLRRQFPKQFIDVGIAEGTAVAIASGIAKNGCKPVFGLSSSFLQRAYDQLSQDLALNNSPAVILVFFAGISQSSQTHMGVFDISLAMNIPNIIYLAPTCREEYLSMLEWGVQQTENSVIIRVPGIVTTTRKAVLPYSYGQPTKYETVVSGSRVAILALGYFFELGVKVRNKLEKDEGICATLINPRYITGIDTEMLEELKKYHQLIITLEDGVIDGGFGEKIARFYGNSSMKVLSFGAQKEFVDNVIVEELYDRYHLTSEQIILDIMNVL